MAGTAHTTAARPDGHTAVMANRADRTGRALDYFPTPPWATRALSAHVLVGVPETSTAWEPAAGGGHMAEVLREDFRGGVHASDVADYGAGYPLGDFLLDARCPFTPDWIITNPPFRQAQDFALRGLDVARRGVALLVRTAWLEGGERYRELFARTPPSDVAVFSERVPMTVGRWDPKASTATSYAWVVWDRARDGATRLRWIPPVCRRTLTRDDDHARFGAIGGGHNSSQEVDQEGDR